MAALGREAGEVFAAMHRDHGVDLRLNTTVDEITTSAGTATGLKLGDGSTVAADAVLVAVGAAANIGLAEQAGLATGHGGVLVDASLRTSDPDIFAVGDIAAAEHPLFGTRIRTEHWANALKQPAVAAAGMLGKPQEYTELPYFFTDQYDLGMEYVGHAPDYDRMVTRGDVAGREFTAFWLDSQNRVLAGMNVNIWEGLDDIKSLIRSREPVEPGPTCRRIGERAHTSHGTGCGGDADRGLLGRDSHQHRRVARRQRPPARRRLRPRRRATRIWRTHSTTSHTHPAGRATTSPPPAVPGRARSCRE